MSRARTSRRNALAAAVIQAVRRSATNAVLFHGALAEEHALTATDTRTLELLDRLGPQSAGEIAAHTGLAATSVTNLIDRLAARGLVERTHHESDRRKVVVKRIPEAAAKLNAPYVALAQATTQLLTEYSDEQLTTIADFLNRSAEYVEVTLAKRTRKDARRAGRKRE